MDLLLRTIIPGQYIVKGSQFIVGQKLRDLGDDVFLIKTKDKIKVDNINVFYNFQYSGEFKESKIESTKSNDALLGDQKHHLMIKSLEAWKISQGSKKDYCCCYG